MEILFAHPSLPVQFGHIVSRLANQHGAESVCASCTSLGTHNGVHYNRSIIRGAAERALPLGAAHMPIINCESLRFLRRRVRRRRRPWPWISAGALADGGGFPAGASMQCTHPPGPGMPVGRRRSFTGAGEPSQSGLRRKTVPEQTWIRFYVAGSKWRPDLTSSCEWRTGSLPSCRTSFSWTAVSV